jgi:HEAT repeat protein
VQQWQLRQQDPGEQRPDIRLLAEAGATQAIPALKQEFAATKDTLLKLAIASALVRLGDKDQPYWDFLAEEARTAVENDAPPVFQLDSHGKVDQRGPSPEFIAWAKAHNLDPPAAAQAQTLELPGNFLYLAETGDPRGRELLRRGLKSSNFTIQSIATRGLAKLHDEDSIPLIVEVCGKMTGERASYIARALLFFDDPRAEAAAEMFIDKPVLEELRKLIRQHGADPFRY